MNTSEVRRILDELPRKSIAVVGDFFIDRYLHIDPTLDEPSLETGLTAYQVTRVRDQAGAAGTVTANLKALGVGTLFAVAVVGEDGPGMSLRRDLAEKGVLLDFLLEDADRLTPTYTKPLRIRPDKPPEEVNRLDVRNRGQTPPEIEDRLIAAIETVVGKVDAVVIPDQISTPDEGMITDRVRDCLIAHARREPEKVFAADSRRDIGLFRDMITKPNQFEAARIMGAGEEAARDPETLEEIGRSLAKRNSRPVFITLGEEGILVCTDTTATRIPTYLSEGEIDTVGAGDSTLSGIVCASMAGASVTDAAILGNLVASITVQQIGTTGTASAEQVARRFGEWAKRHPHLAT